MDKRLFINLQGGRKVSGVLRGFDIFLNLVIDDAVEESTPATKTPIGQVVSTNLLSGAGCGSTCTRLGHPREQCNIDGNTRSVTVTPLGAVVSRFQRCLKSCIDVNETTVDTNMTCLPPFSRVRKWSSVSPRSRSKSTLNY